MLYLLKDFGGSLIFECNYTMKDLSIISIFYRELLQWWSEFRDHFSDEKYWLSIIWNHKDIRINGKPVFYKTYYNSGIYTVSDLLLNLDNVESFEAIKNKIENVNFLTWTGLRHSVPSNLKTLQYELTKGNVSFIYKNDIFDITKVKSKDYYSLMISKKAQLPNNVQKLKRHFNLTEEDLKLAFNLPHIITYKPYAKAFQYKILNPILYTNTKLFKIGYSEHDKCTFCSNESETLHHLFFYCPYSNLFWKSFEKYYFTISSTAVPIQAVPIPPISDISGLMFFISRKISFSIPSSSFLLCNSAQAFSMSCTITVLPWTSSGLNQAVGIWKISSSP